MLDSHRAGLEPLLRADRFDRCPKIGDLFHHPGHLLGGLAGPDPLDDSEVVAIGERSRFEKALVEVVGLDFELKQHFLGHRTARDQSFLDEEALGVETLGQAEQGNEEAAILERRRVR